MQEIINAITENSLEVVLVAYLIYRDRKFNEKFEKYMEKTTVLMDKVFEFMEVLKSGKTKNA